MGQFPPKRAPNSAFCIRVTSIAALRRVQHQSLCRRSTALYALRLTALTYHKRREQPRGQASFKNTFR